MDDTLNFALESFKLDQAQLLHQEVEERIKKSRAEWGEKLEEIRTQRKTDMDEVERKLSCKKVKVQELRGMVHDVIDARLSDDISKAQTPYTSFNSMVQVDREITFLQKSAIETRERIDRAFDATSNPTILVPQIIEIMQVNVKHYVERQEDLNAIKESSFERAGGSIATVLTLSLAQLSVESKFQQEKEQQMQHEFEVRKKSYADIESKLQRKLHTSRPTLNIGVLPPEGEPVPSTLVLDIQLLNFKKDDFHAEFCRILELPPATVTIAKVEANAGNVKVHLLFTGKQEDLPKLLSAMDDPDLLEHFRIIELLVGEFQLALLGVAVMNPKWNKEYGNGKNTYWSGPIVDDYNRGGKPYFCPSGWKRFSIRVFQDDEEFQRKYSGWHVAYHGTAGSNASSILATGLRVGGGCFTQEKLNVYLSPSIEYCGHPRYPFFLLPKYAKPWKNPGGKWVQMVFQCRVHPDAVRGRVYRETLLTNRAVQIDPNFKNEELEWLVEGSVGIVCYGIMLRECDDPRTLAASSWWKYSAEPTDPYFGVPAAPGTDVTEIPTKDESCVIL